MKVALIIDQIVERDLSHNVLNQLCLLYPEASIFTVAHKPYQVTGEFENRRITSSVLSKLTNSKNPTLFKRFLFLSSDISKSWLLDTFDKIICITAGYLYLPNPNTIYYFYKEPEFSLFIRPQIKLKLQKYLKISNKIIFATQSIKEDWFKFLPISHLFSSYSKVILPPMPVTGHDPLLFQHNKRVEKGHYVAKLPQNQNFVNIIERSLRKTNQSVLWMTKEDNPTLKTTFPLKIYKCSGELLKPLQKACATISVGKNNNALCDLALKSIILGIPQILENTAINREIAGIKCAIFIPSLTEKSFTETLQKMNNENDWFEPKEIISCAKKLAPIHFNPQFSRFTS